MNRRLLKQMCHEWRDNIWLILSLMIVFTVVWGAVFLLYVELRGYFSPRGYDCTDVYSIDLRQVGKKSDYYNESGEGQEKQDLAVLLNRLRALPSVESVMFHQGAMPYNFNYWGTHLTVEGGDSLPEYNGNRRSASPEIVDVLRLKSKTGATSEQLKEMLRRGEILIGDSYDYRDSERDVMKLKGRIVTVGADSTLYRVGDVIDVIRRNDYEEAYSGTILVPLNPDEPWGEVAVRVKPGMGKQFEKEFNDNKEVRLNRNVFLTDIKSVDQMRDSNQRTTEIKIRQYIVVTLFVLLTIFLGMLGTFWFRVQQRVGEIAIRRVCGATKGQIMRRVLGEGVILLTAAVLLASALLWTLFIPGFLEESMIPDWWDRVLWCELAAVAAVLIGILLSLLYPARRAMAIEPAIAVKAE